MGIGIKDEHYSIETRTPNNWLSIGMSRAKGPIEWKSNKLLNVLALGKYPFWSFVTPDSSCVLAVTIRFGSAPLVLVLGEVRHRVVGW